MKIVPQEAESLRVRLTAACARVEHLLGRTTTRTPTSRARSPSSGTQPLRKEPN